MFDFIDWIVLIVGSILCGCAVADGLLLWAGGDTGNGLLMLALGLIGLGWVVMLALLRAES